MSTTLDGNRTQAFAEQALAMVNGGCLSLRLSVGHRTGLFDTLATLERATSDRIAAAAGLNERYVREWLGAMVTGRIVEFDPAAQTYWLPREHAASLTRAAGPDNLAEMAQLVAMFGQVENAIGKGARAAGGSRVQINRRGARRGRSAERLLRLPAVTGRDISACTRPCPRQSCTTHAP
jgi:hypothetical protein